MHCHLVVSRKDQANKKKLSPLTNHKNTKNGIIKGGFDRVNLFKQVEQGFDKQFDYDRQPSESFRYHNTIKNGSISQQLELQNQILTGEKKKDVFQSSEKENNNSCCVDSKQISEQPSNLGNSIGGDSLLSIFSLADGSGYDATLVEELETEKRKKKKKKGRKL